MIKANKGIKVKRISGCRVELIPPDDNKNSKWGDDNIKELGFIFWDDGFVSILVNGTVRYVLSPKVWKRLKQMSEMKKYISD